MDGVVRDAPSRVTLDINDTCDVAHGHQQLSLFNAHYDERGFLPIHGYDTEKSRPVAVILRPGKTPSGVEVRSHLRRLVRRIRSRLASHSVGVARQYSGTTGRVENCQIGVFLSYAGPKGHALIDRRLYLPKEWAEDTERRAAASVPDDVTFATKPKIGAAMVEAALQGVPCAWVLILGDSVYGSDKSLCVMLERRQKPYVLCVRGNERLMVGDFHTRAAEELAAGLSPGQWRRFAAGEGSKGPRLYD